MFDWIYMDIVHMGIKVPFIPYQMLPVSSLPDTPFTPFLACKRSVF